ncbi:DUF541 domain-containing protein [bacterium]|nr:MAG: DUF541 domain-containing protein [bacterium]
MTRLSFLFLVLLCTSTVVAQSYSIKDNSLMVFGNGESITPANQAKIRIPIEAQASSLAQSLEKVKQTVNTLTSSLQSIGIPRSDIETPHFSNTKNVNASIFTSKKDFITELDLIVTINNLELLENAIIILADLKAEPTNVTFQLKSADSAKVRAIEQATSQATLKAKAIAAQLGISLGKIISVEEIGMSDVSAQNVMVFNKRGNINDGRYQALYPEKQVIKASVRLVYSLNQ